MSVENYRREAATIVARAQAAAAEDMRATLARQNQRLQDAINAIAASARANGVKVSPSGFILPDVKQVLSLARPQQVLNIQYLF